MAEAQEPQDVQVVLPADEPNQPRNEQVALEQPPPEQAKVQPPGQVPPAQVCV